MIKVFEDFDFTRVGYLQSVMEAQGIHTHIRNEFGSVAAGEVPFVEMVPALWVLEPRDLERARQLVSDFLGQAERSGADWVCRECGAELGAEFEQCWQCQAIRSGPA